MRQFVRASLFFALSFTGLMVPPAFAGEDPQAGPAAPASPSGGAPGIRAYFVTDFNSMTASKSFDAAFDTSHFTAFGGGADVVELWKHLFARFSVTHVSKTGSRAFFDGSQVVSLGIPLTVSMTPVEIGGGWRFPGAPAARLTPYAGGGVVIVSYKETSQFADPSDDFSGSFTGYNIFGGAEYSITQWLVAAGEAQFRSVPNALGDNPTSLSQAFNETDLGGFTLRVTVGIRTKR
jgi:hypothetical protein